MEKNYTVCFAAFSVCMTFALICATRFEFSYDKNEQLPLRIENEDLKKKISSTTNSQEQYSTAANTIKLMQIIQIFITLKTGTFLFIAW
jgi:formate hydrogenlyase subunit 6/NADH:ubiquinone oxidoreductase subunit I